MAAVLSNKEIENRFKNTFLNKVGKIDGEGKRFKVCGVALIDPDGGENFVLYVDYRETESNDDRSTDVMFPTTYTAMSKTFAVHYLQAPGPVVKE